MQNVNQEEDTAGNKPKLGLSATNKAFLVILMASK